MTNTYSSVAKRFQVSPAYVIDLFDKRVDLKGLTLPDVLCVDEIYDRKLTNKGLNSLVWIYMKHIEM